MNLQQIKGNTRTAESRRKAKNRNKREKVISRHTRRFRALFEPQRFPDGTLGAGQRYVGDSVPITVRSLATVGGATRRAMKKRQRVDVSRMSGVAMLPNWMQNGLGAFVKIAQAVAAKYEESKRRV